MAGGLLKVVSAAALGATVAAVASAQARPPSSHERVLCRPFQHLTTAAGRGPRYVVRNDTFGHRSECLVNVDDLPDFRISKSGAHGNPAEPVAYPNIFLGCSWGVCSPRSGLPRRVDRIRTLVTSWSTVQSASGHWSAGYDIWLDRRRSTSGQSGGAELMIWLNSRGFPPNAWPVVTVGGRRYHLAHWVAARHGKRWNYIQFRMVRSAKRVRNLDVLPFIKAAERAGLVRRSWWMVSVEAGFEIWRGGVGLATRWFTVRL